MTLVDDETMSIKLCVTLFDLDELVCTPGFTETTGYADQHLMPEGVSRKLWYVPNLDPDRDQEKEGYKSVPETPTVAHRPNVVSAECTDGYYRLILDIDIPHVYVPSSTPGHGHMYFPSLEFDSVDSYFSALDRLAELGILQHEYVWAARRDGANQLRLKHDKKKWRKDESQPW